MSIRMAPGPPPLPPPGANLASTLAYPPHLIERTRQTRAIVVKGADGQARMAQNALPGGEMWAKNPAGLPDKARYHKNSVGDHDWWLRHNDRSRERTDLKFSYAPQDTMSKQHFNAGYFIQNDLDHSRRVFMELAHQGRSRSEGSLLALREDEGVKRAMQKKYGAVMRQPPAPPGPPKQSTMREGGRPKRLPPVQAPPPEAWLGGIPEDGAASGSAAQRPERVGSRVSASKPESWLMAGAPGRSSAAAENSFGYAADDRPSVLSAAPPPGSFLSACAPLQEEAAGGSFSRLSANAPPGRSSQVSAVAPSQLSEASDFFSWRPRMIM